MLVEANELMSITDIADMFALGQSALSNWRARYADFPQPVATVGRGRTHLFLRSQVLSWWIARQPGGTQRILELADTIRKLESEKS
jgi:hypothetical protein